MSPTPPPHDMHGLTWDASKQKWRLRLTIDLGEKIVGKRLCMWLATTDAHEAVVIRDAIIAWSEKQLGLTVRVCIQNRKRCNQSPPENA